MLAPLAVIATGVSALRSTVWWVRCLDYPRLHIASLGIVAFALGSAASPAGLVDRGLLAATLAAAVAQLLHILPYTPLWKRQMVGARGRSEGATLRVLVANVLDKNRDHRAFLQLVARVAPDVVLAVETNSRWMDALADLDAGFPHHLKQPQENGYGLGLWSRLPLERARIERLVDPTVPSVHATIVLRSGQRVSFHGLHPRPPAPAESTDTTKRDAEIVMVGRAARHEPLPTIVAGDLNDVAWSHTSRLFIRVSGLLDPRRGRGFFNTFNSRQPLLRFPVDHVFASARFTLVALAVLPAGGSDHFPVLVELALEPDTEGAAQLERPAPSAGDEEEVRETIRNALTSG